MVLIHRHSYVKKLLLHEFYYRHFYPSPLKKNDIAVWDISANTLYSSSQEIYTEKWHSSPWTSEEARVLIAGDFANIAILRKCGVSSHLGAGIACHSKRGVIIAPEVSKKSIADSRILKRLGMKRLQTCREKAGILKGSLSVVGEIPVVIPGSLN
jgi:hypothetical protein